MTTTNAPAPPIARRHDLDALRAFAMLLGIVLHGALAFIPGAWAVTDSSVQGDGTPFALLTTAIHGFRMPLFFLMSGFFTAMLLRQRGLPSLLRQRSLRILLPLALATITVIPLTGAAWNYAAGASPADSATGDDAPPELSARDNIWTAAALGDIPATQAHLAEGASLDAYDPTFGVTPLAWTALHNRENAATWLLDAGADVDARNRDLSTPLHSAAFMGRADIVRLLLERNADPNALDANGFRPLDSSRADPETTAGLAELLGVAYDNTTVDDGRREVAQLLGAAAVKTPSADDRADAARGVAPYGDAADSTTDTDPDQPLLIPWYWEFIYSEEWSGLFVVDVFSHLWFLWHLIWLVGAFALVAWIASRLPLRFPRIPSLLVVTPALYLWTVPLTMAAQYFMGVEGNYPEFGPDTYTGLLPPPHLLAYYAIFFAFGALYFHHNEGGARIGRWWQATLPLALIVLLAGAALTFPEEGGVAQGTARWASLALQSAYAWMMTLALIGLFRAILQPRLAPSPTPPGSPRSSPAPQNQQNQRNQWSARVRYLSDASYWLYIAHLPLIIALQGATQNWPLPAALKLTLLIALTAAPLLLAYEWAVRYTLIGALLNGRRSRPRPAPSSP